MGFFPYEVQKEKTDTIKTFIKSNDIKYDLNRIFIQLLELNVLCADDFRNHYCWNKNYKLKI